MILSENFDTTVTVERVNTYERKALNIAIRKLLAPYGGMKSFINPGETVLLKPNMLYGKHPDMAVTTHPNVIRAVIEIVKEAGGYPLVGDSPGSGSTRNVAEKCGILAVVEETGAELVEFTESISVKGTGIFKSFDIAKPYMTVDRVINLPKLKTHVMMTMTCAVKNLFGVVVGKGKAGWHLKAGEERDVFAQILLELSLVRKTDLTIVDAITAMEGDGPGSGDPCQLGLLMAGTNPVAVDVIAGEIIGIPKNLLYTENAAARIGIVGSKHSEINVKGLDFDQVPIRTFRLPRSMGVPFGLPLGISSVIRHQFTNRPMVIPERCKLCGICIEACPPNSIMVKNKCLHIDYQQCIRCFCCVELCPEGALKVGDGSILKIIKKAKRIVKN